MIFPNDLPGILHYRVGNTVIVTLPRKPVQFVGSGGSTTAATVCPRIPYGCSGWRRVSETEWRGIDTLPVAWLPYLNRERGSEMDPRTKETKR